MGKVLHSTERHAAGDLADRFSLSEERLDGGAHVARRPAVHPDRCHRRDDCPTDSPHDKGSSNAHPNVRRPRQHDRPCHGKPDAPEVIAPRRAGATDSRLNETQSKNTREQPDDTKQGEPHDGVRSLGKTKIDQPSVEQPIDGFSTTVQRQRGTQHEEDLRVVARQAHAFFEDRL